MTETDMTSPRGELTEQPHRHYHDPQIRARVAIAALWLVLASAVALFVMMYLEWRMLGDFQDGDISLTRADASDTRMRFAGWSLIGAVVLCGITFIAWIRRITLNLRPMVDGKLKYGARWATLGWFVPVLAIWRPKQVINQASRATSPELPAEPADDSFRKLAVPAWVTVWWVLLMVDSLVGRASAAARDANNIDDLMSADVFGMVYLVLPVVAAVLGVCVVTALTSRQRARAQQLGIREWNAMDDYATASGV